MQSRYHWPQTDPDLFLCANWLGVWGKLLDPQWGWWVLGSSGTWEAQEGCRYVWSGGVASQPPRLLSPLTLSMLLIWAVKPPLLTGTLSPVPHSGAQAGGLGGSLLWWWSWPEQALWELACLPCSLNWLCLLLFSYPASCWSCISTLTPAFPLPGVPYTPPKLPNNHTAAPPTPPWCPGCQKPLLIPSEQDVFFCCPSPCLLLVTTWHISYLSIYSLYSLPWM